LKKQEKIDKPARKRLSWSDISGMSPEEIAAHSRPERTKRSIKQGKRGRPPSENPMIHTAIVLPRDLLKQMKSDAEQSGRGLSGEIRHRLQSTYEKEKLPRDPETTEFVELVRRLAASLAADLGKQWHERNYGVAAFNSGVAAFLTHYQRQGDEAIRDIPGHNDNPEIVGRTHARLIMAQRAEEKQAEEKSERVSGRFGSQN
jgi:hypothetical protein